MKKINIAITGGLGKMGQKIINSSKKDKKFKITSITESKVLNKKVSGLELQINSKNALSVLKGGGVQKTLNFLNYKWKKRIFLSIV